MSHPPVVAATALLVAWGATTATGRHSDPNRYLEHFKVLAADGMDGRAVGTDGLRNARRYIETEFERFGLKPCASTTCYLQPFTVITGAELGDGNRLSVSGNGQASETSFNNDYLPLSFSSNDSASGPLVFAGYGASAPAFDYDDYVRLNVKDKTVIVLLDEPSQFAPEKDVQPTHHAHLIWKAINARNRGAKAIIFIRGKLEQGAEHLLTKFGSVPGPENAGIMIIQAKREIVDAWLNPSGQTILGLREQIEKDGRPKSFSLPDSLTLSVAVDIERKHAEVNNVLGYLPGETGEYLILGAHYDHLGHGGPGSLAPSQEGEIHHGADDNASGVAGLLELARILGARRQRLRRGILFIAFSAEEVGLLGARAWVEHPTYPLDKAVAMLNPDMIRRIRDRKVYLGGLGTGSSFEALLKELEGNHQLQLEKARSSFSSSDHTVFVCKRIPVLFFFSGLHGDYHKPSDTWDKIDAETASELVDLVADIADRLATVDRQRFVHIDPERGHGAVAIGSTGGGYGPWFGSVRDFGEVENGVKFAHIRPGSPADQAGLKGGDVLVQWNDKPIKNLYNFTYAPRASKIGETVTVQVIRDGEKISANVTLAQRK